MAIKIIFRNQCTYGYTISLNTYRELFLFLNPPQVLSNIYLISLDTPTLLFYCDVELKFTYRPNALNRLYSAAQSQLALGVVKNYNIVILKGTYTIKPTIVFFLRLPLLLTVYETVNRNYTLQRNRKYRNY